MRARTIAAVGKQSKSRRERARQRQDRGAPTPSPTPPAAPDVREASPLLAKYKAEPIADLPGETKRFHLRVVHDMLDGYDRRTRAVGALWAAQTWHEHHDGLARSRPDTLMFDGAEKQLACKPGCNHCCHTPVGVVAAEAVLVAHVVARTFSPQDRLALQERIDGRKAALARGESPQGLLCPLNVGGQCQVYEFRPYNCRMFHSFDVGACERLFRGTEEEEPHRRLPIDPVRKQFDGLIVASANVAFRALKLDTRMLEFMAALELALAAGEDRCERFGAGEDLFAGLPTIASASPSA